MALTLLSVAIIGMASVFASAARTSGVDLHRTTAIGLATKATEDLKTFPYGTLGLPTGTVSAPACDVAATIVIVDGSTLAVTDPPSLSGGVTYTVNRCITWADAATGQAQAYKHTTVIVTWTDFGLPHTVRQDSLRYPGGLGAYVAPGASLTTTTVLCVGSPFAPGVTATPSGDARTVDLKWDTPTVSPAARAWAVDYRLGTSGAFSVYSDVVVPSPPTARNELLVSGLAPGTTYQFQVRALASPGCTPSVSSPVAVTTLGSAGGACVIGLVSVGSPIVRDSGDDHLSLDIPVTVATSGTSVACSALVPQMSLSYQPSSVPATATLTLASAGTYTGLLLASGNWDLGDHVVSVVEGAAIKAQARFCVVRAGASSC